MRMLLVLVVLGSTILLTARSSSGETLTDCRASPRPSAPQGTHWYYRVDRTNSRHCWFLSSSGVFVRSHRIVATSNRTPQNSAEQAWTSSQNETVQTASPQLTSTGTVSAEIPPVKPSVGERRATDFVGRWLDLPNSVDLDARKPATPPDNYTDAHISSDSRKNMPSSWFVTADTSSGLRRSPDMANFGSIFLVGALGALLFGGTLKLTRKPHAWPALAPKERIYELAIGLGELTRALRRIDETVDSPRSPDRWPVGSHRSLAIEERQNERAFDSAVRPGQHSVPDLVVTLP
jgi:hypothetical protein